MFRVVRGLKIYSEEDEGEICIKGSDGKLCFSEKERGCVSVRKKEVEFGKLIWKES